MPAVAELFLGMCMKAAWSLDPGLELRVLQHSLVVRGTEMAGLGQPRF